MNPIPEFVVAPSIVIASPMFGMASDSRKEMKTITKVTITFCLVDNFYPGSKKSSSTVSLQGKIVRGVANKMTVRIPKSEMKLTVMGG